MTQNKEHIYVQVRELRNKLRDILDSTQFFGQCYVVTNYGRPMAQITAPSPDEKDGDINVTDVRTRTKAILEAVCYEGKTFLVHRYGKAAATILPIPESLTLSGYQRWGQTSLPDSDEDKLSTNHPRPA